MNEKGLTLIEVIITIVMLVVLVSVLTYIFRVILISWSSQETRAGSDINLDRAMEEMSRDLREANQAQSANDEIRFKQGQNTYLIYYLYNMNDSYPPDFSQASYQIRRDTLNGGINGTFTYGQGQIIATDVLAPPVSDLSFASNMITLDLSIKRNDETVRARTLVKPRNL